MASEYQDQAAGDEQDRRDRDALGAVGERGGQQPPFSPHDSLEPPAAITPGPGLAITPGPGLASPATDADRAAPAGPGARPGQDRPADSRPGGAGTRAGSEGRPDAEDRVGPGGEAKPPERPDPERPAESGLPTAFRPPGGFGSALSAPGSPGPYDPHDSPGRGAGHGPAGEYFPPATYAAAAGHPAGAYGAEPYGAEPYGAGAYGSASDYGASDSYGQPGDYGPGEGYGPAAGYLPPDPYLSGQSYFPPDPYGPDPYGPPAAGPAGSRGSQAAAAPGPALAPPAAPARPDPGPLPSADPLAAQPADALHVAPGGRGATAGFGLPDGHDDLSRPQEPAEPTESLTPEFLLPGRRRAPAPGWRRVLYQATAGLLRVPESAAELRRRDMINRIRTPVAGGHHRVAVLSLKGGVGKTTTTVGLGATLASLRGDRVIAVDANPDRGTLSDKVRLETAATVRDLLNERGQVGRYADVRAYTSQAPSRLEVLASDRDPTVSVAFSEEDYCEVSRVLEHYYSICLTDCGTGLLHSAMAGVLRMADQIVLVSSPSVDGARSASATLDWLAAHAYGELVRGAVVVLSIVRPSSKNTVDLDRLEQHFAARCRAVTRIPYDPHLAEGAEVELDQLSRAAADAYLGLAAIVGDGLAWPRNAAHPGMAQPSAARRRTAAGTP